LGTAWLAEGVGQDRPRADAGRGPRARDENASDIATVVAAMSKGERQIRRNSVVLISPTKPWKASANALFQNPGGLAGPRAIFNAYPELHRPWSEMSPTRAPCRAAGTDDDPARSEPAR
jgi:hypothetical protein